MTHKPPQGIDARIPDMQVHCADCGHTNDIFGDLPSDLRCEKCRTWIKVAPKLKSWNQTVEDIRTEMMRRFSDKLSMEEIASFAYEVGNWRLRP